MVRLRDAAALGTPFALIALVHYGRYATLLPAGSENIAGRAKVQHQADFRRRMAQRMHQLEKAAAHPTPTPSTDVPTSRPALVATVSSSMAGAAASVAASVRAGVDAATSSAATASRRSRPTLSSGMSSEEAVHKVLEQAGLRAGMSDVHGLGDVTTAEAFHKALAPGEAVWLTFSNAAYLHFACACGSRSPDLWVLPFDCSLAFVPRSPIGLGIESQHRRQNWYMSVRAIGRHRQVVVAALDAQTLQTWRSLRVPVLDYTQFGDSSGKAVADHLAHGLESASHSLRLTSPLPIAQRALATDRELARGDSPGAQTSAASVPTRPVSGAWVP